MHTPWTVMIDAWVNPLDEIIQQIVIGIALCAILHAAYPDPPKRLAIECPVSGIARVIAAEAVFACSVLQRRRRTSRTSLPLRFSHGHHNLANLAVRFHVLVCVNDLLKTEGAGDERF